MSAAPLPPDEAQRLQALDALAVLDTPAEEEFDALVQAAAALCGTPVSLISLIDSDRQWFKARTGVDARETDRSLAFCSHAILEDTLFEVPDATLDPRFADNALVTGDPNIRFYAGAPLQLASGARIGTLCVIDRQPRTLTEQQRSVLGHLARAAVKALEGRRATLALAAADARKNEFLATLAHELRNPLAPLRSGLQTMRVARRDPVAMERAGSIMERQLAHLVRLVDDLLDVARISGGKVLLQPEPTELKALVQAAVELSQPQVARGQHTLQLDLPPQPLPLHADPARVVQIISNLLNNAAKYTPSGGRIQLRAAADGDLLVLTVQDNGIGLSPSSLHSIFDMFTQVTPDGRREQGGLGVGLALVRRLVELHGGSVTASSDGIGLGSTFTLRLPAFAVASMAEASRPEPGPADAAPQHKRVLVVDDSVDAAESLAALLEIDGHTVRTAHSGAHALQLVNGFVPDVAFIDIGMPDMNGYQLATTLRALPALQRTLLVALSGWGADKDVQRAKAAGFDRHLTKPADLDDLYRVLADSRGG